MSAGLLGHLGIMNVDLLLNPKKIIISFKVDFVFFSFVAGNVNILVDVRQLF